MEKSLAWSKATKGIWHGVLGYAISSFIGGLTMPIASADSILSKVKGIVDNGNISVLSNYADIIPISALAVCVVFLWLIISNLDKLCDLVAISDVVHVSRLRSTFIIEIVAIAVTMLPVSQISRFIGGIIFIVAFFIQKDVYASLSGSTTLPTLAANGMHNLFTYASLALIGTILGFVPILDVVSLIVNFVAILFMLVGWAKVGYSHIW